MDGKKASLRSNRNRTKVNEKCRRDLGSMNSFRLSPAQVSSLVSRPCLKPSPSPRFPAGFLASLHAARLLLPVHSPGRPALVFLLPGLLDSSCAVPSPQLSFTASRVPVTEDHDFPKTVTITGHERMNGWTKTTSKFKQSPPLQSKEVPERLRMRNTAAA